MQVSIGSLYSFLATEKTEAHPSRSSSGMDIQKVRGSQDAEERVGLRMENSIITLGLRHCDEANRLLLSWSRLKGSWLPLRRQRYSKQGEKGRELPNWEERNRKQGGIILKVSLFF